jgi:hypothetical protein
MSVVSAPSRAGRSPYNSEPLIEGPEATNPVGRNRPETPANVGDPRSPRANHRRRALGGLLCGRTHSHGTGAVGGLVEAAVEIPMARPVSMKGAMATYPSPRASEGRTLGLGRRKPLEIENMRLGFGGPGRPDQIQGIRVRFQS